MADKQEFLKPRLLECIERLKSFIQVDAPGVIIGAEAFNVFATTLAVYGDIAGSTFIQHVRDQNLHGRGVCSNEDCINPVVRPSLGFCGTCADKLDIPADAVEVL